MLMNSTNVSSDCLLNYSCRCEI